MLLTLLFTCLLSAGVWAQECPTPEDILPCECTQNIVSKALSLDCSKVLDVLELQNVFQAPFPTTTFKEFTMRGNRQSPIPIVYFPDDLFGDVSFQTIFIEYTAVQRIGDNIFENSYDQLEVLRVTNCELVTFPSISIANFSKIALLDISHNNLTYVQDLRSDTLSILYLESNPGLHFSKNLLEKVPQLGQVTLSECDLMTMTPNLFITNGHLDTVYLQSNNLTYLQSESLAFMNNSVTRVVLSNNAISNVEANFISGTSNKMELFLVNNQLSELTEDVWKPVFQQTSSEGLGMVVLDGNPLKCDCSMAWLVINPLFFQRLGVGATCEDGTSVHSLNPDDFSDC